MATTKMVAAWRKKAAPLIGRKIVDIRALSPAELQVLGWHSSPTVLVLDDGNCIFAAADDEGNGPGATFTTYQQLPTLPVLG